MQCAERQEKFKSEILNSLYWSTDFVAPLLVRSGRVHSPCLSQQATHLSNCGHAFSSFPRKERSDPWLWQLGTRCVSYDPWHPILSLSSWLTPSLQTHTRANPEGIDSAKFREATCSRTQWCSWYLKSSSAAVVWQCCFSLFPYTKLYTSHPLSRCIHPTEIPPWYTSTIGGKLAGQSGSKCEQHN